MVKLTHTFKETDKCAQNCGIVDSFSCKMPEIYFETLWIFCRGYSVADRSLSIYITVLCTFICFYEYATAINQLHMNVIAPCSVFMLILRASLSESLSESLSSHLTHSQRQICPPACHLSATCGGGKSTSQSYDSKNCQALTH